MYASENVFGGWQTDVDYFAYGRICLFLALDWSDFIQLNFMPIEDDEMLKIVRHRIRSFEIIKKVLKCLKPGPKYGPLTPARHHIDVSKCPKLKITRSNLNSAGIPSNWFIEPTIYGFNTIQSENLKCQNQK